MAETRHDIRNGGVPTLRLSRHVAGDATVTDRTTGLVADPGSYTVQAQSVKRNRGVWPRGSNRWLVEYAEGEPDAS